MNIALIFPPFYFEPMYNLPPLGLINLATVLKPSPHRVRIFDFPLDIRRKALHMDRHIYRACAKHVMQFRPDLAAFSVQCTTYPPAVRIAQELKKLNPELKIAFGGHNASCVDELTLSRFPFIDAIVRCEGEITFRELVRAFEGQVPLASIDGITFRTPDRIVRNPDRELIENLDSLPASDYAFVAPLHQYRDVCGIGRSVAILEVGRGCPHRCVYCSQSIMWRRRARTFSTDRIIGEMKNLAENFGAECFLLAFDQFTAKRSFAEQFCLGLIDAGLNHLPWYCISRLDTVDKDLLILMRKAGCETMCYGIDSGSKKTLAFIRKDIDREVLFDRVRETTEAGIVPTLSFVIGFPEESRQDLEATLELALKSAATGNANILVQMTTILPGTDLYEKYRSRLVRDVDTYFSLGIEFDQGARIASDDALIDSDPDIFSSFYNVPCPAASLEELNLTANYFTIIATLYPRSFFLLSLELNRSILDLFLSFLDRVAEIESIHRRGAENAERTKFQQDRQERRSISPDSQDLEIAFSVSPANPVNPVKKGPSLLDRTMPRPLRLCGERLRLTPQACLAHFSEFASESLARHDILVRDYIPEVVKYETCLLSAGKAGASSSPFHIDPSRIGSIKPLRNEKTLIERFTFDIPSLILELKFGHFPDTCPQRAVFLAFTGAPDGTQVREINEFGFDFLRLCDGLSTLEEIANQLYPKYGIDKDHEQFVVICAEAAGTLAGLEVLAPS
ncbi:MAG: radical SAM protein [Syntrophobacteraceae bacterium]